VEVGCASDNIEDHLPLVSSIVAKMKRRLPSFVEEEDLFQYGFFGLKDAWDKFDPSRGVKFAAYAATRVRGAILDGLRSMDWVPRLARQRKEAIVHPDHQ
jgi:RNA polymerase sigma factor FliA